MRRLVLATCLVIGGCQCAGEATMDRGRVAETREALLADVWPVGALPDAPPEAVERGVSVAGLSTLPEVASIDRVRLEQDYGLSSTLLYLRPREPNGALMIYHLGHVQGFGDAVPAVRRFLGEGYAVLYVAMPLMGPNPNGVRVEVAGESVELRDHNSMLALERAGLPTMHLFLEPVARGLAWAIRESAPTHVHMSGLSGGGWTTTLYAAIDPRVEWSFPIAGSMPHELREGGDVGDFEQLAERSFYGIAPYPALYVLGGAGEGRGQVQILNDQDDCCFATLGREDAVRAYERAARRDLASVGRGHFEVHIIRDQVRHAVTPESLDVIVERLEAIAP